MMRWLITCGVALVLIGVVGFGLTVQGRTDRYDVGHVPLVGEVQAREAADVSRVWPILSGLSLAAGAACIGIGMNQWRQVRSR